MNVLTRETRETRVRLALGWPGDAAAGDGAPASIDTRVRFLDHMLTSLARTSGLRLSVEARGDLRHHVVEDVAITLGEALTRVATGRIARYGERTVAMDDALVQVVIDVGGRSWYRGPLPSGLYDHFLRSFCDHARVTLHVRVLRGRDRHHVVEAAFKALGLALAQALAPAADESSTKGAVRWGESC
jgi:imidazoleglycerol-phosphate dehydratase